MIRILLLEIAVPMIILLTATVFFSVTDADLTIATLFYSTTGGWFLEDVWLLGFLHSYGGAPALLVSIAAACYLLCGFFLKRPLQHGKAALYFVLVFGIGAGLVVNIVFKDNWGRPRPSQVERFGGPRQFLSVWEKQDCRECKSFPCGDASHGFVFLSLFFLLKKSSRRWALLSAFSGLGYGTLLGLCRMARGAHFASDVIWSAGFMYLVSVMLFYTLRMHIHSRTSSLQGSAPPVSA